MQFFVAVDPAVVPVEPLQFHAGWCQTKEAHAAVYRAQHCIHPGVAEHAAEIGHVIVQFQLVIQQHLQHHVQCLIKQAALQRIVVVLQEGTDQFVRVLKLSQREMNQQLQLENSQLPPIRILVTFDRSEESRVGKECV